MRVITHPKQRELTRPKEKLFPLAVEPILPATVVVVEEVSPPSSPDEPPKKRRSRKTE